MIHPAQFPAPPCLKLPNVHRVQRQGPKRNQWLAVDRAERWRPVITLAILVAGFGVGAVLILSGLTR